MECLPLSPTYICEKGRTLSKTYGIKAGCNWEHPWGTHWELVGTKEKRQKSFCPPPQPDQTQKKKKRHLECMLSLPIGCMKLLFPKLVGVVFNLD